MTYLKVFLKIFLSGAIMFGLPVGLFFSLAYNFPLNVIAGVLSGIFFGLAVAFISAPKQIDSEGKEIPVRHQAGVELDLPYEKAFEKCLQTVRLLERVNKVSEDKSKGIIKADVNFSWTKGSGDIVEINLERKEDNKTFVRINSKPWLPITVADGGRNIHNVDQIIAGLKGTHPTIDKVLYGLYKK